jgi:dephospho-CoA kinase
MSVSAAIPEGVLVVGLTGGIATGKSTVSGMLRELGVPVVDADALVHDLMAPDGPAVAPIVRAFGEACRSSDGGIDRERLAEVVFSDKEARARLEEIVHPMVHTESARRLAEEALLSPSGVVVYDAALLVETQRHEEFARLVVVATDRETQLTRLMDRDGLDADDAGARVRAQLPVEAKVEVADYVIDNSGPWHATRRQVAHLVQQLEEDVCALREGRSLPEREEPGLRD